MVFAACESADKRPPTASPRKHAKKYSAADNSFCYDCHINFLFEDEEIALVHERVGIGCTHCHGKSIAHRNDEDSINAPDVMYPRAKINPSCMMCHPGNELIEEDAHRPVLSGAATQEKYCTDCHGDHRLAVRTRLWDKETGELVWDDGVRVEEGLWDEGR